MKLAVWFRLFVDLLVVAIRLSLELLTVLGHLLAFLMRDLVIPLVRTGAEGAIALAGVAAARRAARASSRRQGRG